MKGKICESLCCVILSLNSIPPRSKQLPNSRSAVPPSVLYPLVGSSKRQSVMQWDFAVRYVRVMAVFAVQYSSSYSMKPLIIRATDSGDTSFTLREATCSERGFCTYVTCELCCGLIRQHIQGRLNFFCEIINVIYCK
jgi:hypothetical protein